MSVTLSDDKIRDLIKGTLKHLGRLQFNQIATRLQHYEVMPRILKKDKVILSDGAGIQRNIMVDHSGAAKHVGMYNTDAVGVGDVLQTINIPWRHTTTNWAWDRREMLMNRGASRIVELTKVRRCDGMISLAELMETAFFSKPDTSADELIPFGLPYWVVKHVTGTSSSAQGGFNGGNPSGFADGAGNLNTTTHTRWKNWTGKYVNISKTDAIRGMRKALRNTNLKSPVDIPDYRKGVGQNYRLYVNEETLDALELAGEAQNENLGRDLFPMDGRTTFRRNPIVWAPILDSDTDDPIWFINWSWFHPVFLKGDYLRESEPEKSKNSHNVWVVHVDCTWNILCTNRREQAVLSKTASYGV